MMLIGQIANHAAGTDSHRRDPDRSPKRAHPARAPGGTVLVGDIDAIGAHVQGTSREDALMHLAALVELTVETKGFKVNITDAGPDRVYVTANKPALLAARVLRYQRERHGLTLAAVAKKLGASSVNAYAAYEQGKREPSLSKYLELLDAVAPEVMLSISVRAPGPGVYVSGNDRVPRSAARPTGTPRSKGAQKL